MKNRGLAAKQSKNSSPGLDAWTVKEIKLLPEPAWKALHHILTERFTQIENSLAAVVKRVPLEKIVGATRPEHLRPIDLFSVYHASVLFSGLHLLFTPGRTQCCIKISMLQKEAPLWVLLVLRFSLSFHLDA